ncbi:MAG: prepilin-type N-terminal cleavage/methylation domain-containing protein [Planctomycetota bacterium]|nr:prepilin-type N-terminal cleavage/methylation domain-containing protein [Planctomycetota bacterium]
MPPHDQKFGCHCWLAQQCRGRRKRGFTLLEVILALAILVGAIAVIGELVRNGLNSGTRSRELSRAALLCESTLAEVQAGLIPPTSSTTGNFPDEPGWTYSIDSAAGDVDGLLQVRITVTNTASYLRPQTTCSLVRWMRDPDYVASAMAAAEAATAEDTTSESSSSDTGSSGSSGSSSTGGS